MLMRKLPPLIFLFFSISLEAVEPNQICTLMMDFPYGENRIHLEREGKNKLFYGAAATHKEIASGLFSIEGILEQIEDNLEPNVPRQQRRQPGAQYGQVSLIECSGEESVYLVTNIESFAEYLFNQANENIEYEGF